MHFREFFGFSAEGGGGGDGKARQGKESNQGIESKNRIKESNQGIESSNRTQESNQ